MTTYSCFIPRRIAEWLKMDLSRAERIHSVGAGGGFTTYKTGMHIEIIYRGIHVTLK